MTENSKENQQLTAEGEIIRKNILRLFGTMQAAADRMGYSRMSIWKMIQAGQVTDKAAGRLYKIGIDPAELVRQIRE